MLALALALSGLADGFRAETSATVNSLGASSWVMSRSAHGSISTTSGAFPAADVSEVARQPGIHRASEVLVAPGSRPRHRCGCTTVVTLVGVQPGGLGDPTVALGHRLTGPDQVVVDSLLQASPGGMLYLGGLGYRVVGVVDGRT